MILESDPVTGQVRKQYIGMVTMLDVLVHVAGVGGPMAAGDEQMDLETKMSVQASEVIGRCVEGLSLWTLNPNTRFHTFFIASSSAFCHFSFAFC